MGVLGSGGAAYALVGAGQTAAGVYNQAVDGSKANIDFTGLGGYNELLVIGRNLTDGTTGVRQVQVSVDGGSTFYGASGDYLTVDSNGAEANATSFFHTTSSTAARSIWVHIHNMKGTEKHASVQNSNGIQAIFVASALDVNAIRVSSSGGGNITGGTVRVYGR